MQDFKFNMSYILGHVVVCYSDARHMCKINVFIFSFSIHLADDIFFSAI